MYVTNSTCILGPNYSGIIHQLHYCETSKGLSDSLTQYILQAPCTGKYNDTSHAYTRYNAPLYKARAVAFTLHAHFEAGSADVYGW